MNTYIKIFSALCALAAAASSCMDMETRKVYEGSALGATPKLYTLPATECMQHIEVIANQEYSIRCDADWISAPSVSQGRDGFDIVCSVNGSMARSALVILSIDEANHRDTLTIRQRGSVIPAITFEKKNHIIKGSEAGKTGIAVTVNVPDDEVECSIEYLGSSKDWISGANVSSGFLTFDHPANPSPNTRKARLTVSVTDGWGEVTESIIYISQMNNEDGNGTEMTFAQLRELASEEGTGIDSDIIIEGIVVSNRESGNTGDNTQTDEDNIDYSVCERTVYLESIDGSCGLRLDFDEEKDNIFKPGDRLKLTLFESTLYKSSVTDAETDPVFYWLTDINSGMILEYTPGSSADIPVKTKTIGTLTDDDIFTYVTLTDCEIPVRKGSLTPINEAFSEVADAEKVAKFPILLRDKDGNSMYIYTNTTCVYRRDGEALPYGSGTMSGIIVHEHYTRFEFQDTESDNEDTYGNIGRYQIRHTSKDDFGMAKTMEEASFSAILCEWRYTLGQYMEKHEATDGDMTAYFTSTFVYDDKNETYIKDGRAGKLAYTMYNDYSYLGPVDVAGNINGLGVTLGDGTYWMGPSYNGTNSDAAAKINSDGYGWVPAGAGSAWCTNITRYKEKPQAMVIVFSTKGISTSQLSLQMAMMNDWTTNSAQIPGPRRWHIEYSLDNSTYTRIQSFTVPDYLQTNIPQVWQTAGFKQMDFALPADTLCGKDKVYIRVIPDENMEAGSRAAYIDPSSKTTNNGSYRSCWNYIGIRYNR